MSDRPRLAARAAALLRERLREAGRDAAAAVRAGASAAWASRPAAPRAAAIALAAVVTLAGAGSVLAQARAARGLPSALDWAAARALVERDARPGDAAAVSPAWAERARELLPSSVPVLPFSRPSGEDLVGVRRVWLLALRDAPWARRGAELDLAGRAARTERAARLGALEVTRFDLSFPTIPLAFLPDRLGQATVTLGGAPCEPAGPARFRCAGGAVEVAREVREVAGVPRPCLTASGAAPLDAPLAIAFAPLRLGRTVHGHAGPAGDAGPRAPVRISVLLDGEEAGAAELPGGGWSPFLIDTSRSAGQQRSLSLAVTSPGRLALCLDAMVLP
jgi:hypothetical protein